jgi:hypothetical protein
LDELKKILELEGLLGKYGYLFDDNGNSKNNYRDSSLCAHASIVPALLTLTMCLTTSRQSQYPEYPNLFLFKLGKAELTDNSQLINLDELQRLPSSTT